MQKTTVIIAMLVALCTALLSQELTFNDTWNTPGFSVASQSIAGVDVNFSIDKFTMRDLDVDGQNMTEIELPGVFLPNDAGAPNLPGDGRWIAVPQGAKAAVSITSSRVETYENVLVAPAPHIPWGNEDGPLEYVPNQAIYGTNAFYPAQPVRVSDPTTLRGVDAVILGITPFQYNPVTKELRVYRDLQVHVDFLGGNGHIGQDRLRSRWWDPMYHGVLLNVESLPEVQYPVTHHRTPDYEYVILTPDTEDYLTWADSLSRFRNRQGIRTGVVTLTEAGGNSATAIENYINSAVNTWDVPPVAMLILGDYGTGAGQVTTATWDNYCISDNFYSDINGDDLADIAVARMTANNADQLGIMMEKVFRYENNPYTDPEYYNHPVIAGGWQSDRWFILCADVVYGFLANALNKEPIHEYADGSAGMSSWSSATNTATVVNYFGPNGQGYIPPTPSYLTDWGGNATRINADLNAGAFMILHRDHGDVDGWSSPSYTNSNLNSLQENPLTYVFSLNCLTGKFNNNSECFAEAFHRYENRALGIIAATEVSYSFVNDAYCWGMMDYMWPSFMPDYGEDGPDCVRPAFANAYGKVFLAGSAWPWNPENKEVTYYLFHTHGDAFTTVYTEVPQNLTVDHMEVLPCGMDYYDVYADEGAFIALSVNNEVIGTGIGQGNTTPTTISIEPQFPPDVLHLTVTKQNYYRHDEDILVVPLDAPYLVHEAVSLNDSNGNNDQILDYSDGEIAINLSLENVGTVQGNAIAITLTCEDEYVTITDCYINELSFPGETVTEVADAFTFEVSPFIPDMHVISFTWTATDGEDTWDSSFLLTAHAPIIQLGGFTIDDNAGGNGNGRFEAGETVNIMVTVNNAGTSAAYDVLGDISTNDPYVVLNQTSQSYGEIAGESSGVMGFSATSAANTPIGHLVYVNLNMSADLNLTEEDQFHFPVGQIPVLIIDWDENSLSAPVIQSCLDANNVSAEIVTELPEESYLYTSLFICLGVSGTNHVLTADEGQALADFLDQGGKIYMEGGDTWFADDATVVHDMFNITGNSNGAANLGPIMGVLGNFAQGMTFNYYGNNVSIDHLTPVSPAVAIFRNYNPNYYCMVAYDGGTYQTIGTSISFGGLIDGTTATRVQLMANILDFFLIGGTPLGTVSGTVTLQPAANPEEVDITVGGMVAHPAADGTYSLELAPGDYTVTASLDEYETISSDITVLDGVQLTLDFTLCQTLAPTNLQYQFDGENLTLGWSAPTQTERKIVAHRASVNDGRALTGYNIYCSMNDGDFELVAGTSETSYSTQLAQSNMYRYYVTATYDGGESNPSAEVEVKALEAPQNLQADVQSHNVALSWQACSATGGLTFGAYRIYCDEEQVNEIEDEATTNWTHQAVAVGTHGYTITALWGGYETDPGEPVEVNILSNSGGAQAPAVTAMQGNYPNPFNPVTSIRYSLADSQPVVITVYNILGQKVRTFNEGVQSSGSHSVTWNGTDGAGRAVASGIYFFRLQAGTYTEVRKGVLMK